MKGPLFGYIHSTAQFVFQIGKQASRKPRWRLRTGLDQQVEIAILPCLTPRERAEHAHTRDTMPRRDGMNRSPFIRAQLTQSHPFPFSHHNKFGAVVIWPIWPLVLVA
jgi:hypothetical protein